MSEIEEKAQKMGWVPEEEWHGDPDKWRPADEFVERGENILPIVRANAEKTKSELEEMKADLKIIVKTQQQELERVRNEERARAEAEYNRKLAELDKKELEAFEERDTDMLQEVKKERAMLTPPPRQESQVNPVFEEWHKENDWYAADVSDTDADPELTDFANGIFLRITGQNPGMPPKQAYDEVEKAVKKAFPHKFENQNRNGDTMVDTGTHTASSGRKKTFSDLPADAKKAYERQKQRVESAGGKFTKEDYAKIYFEEE